MKLKWIVGISMLTFVISAAAILFIGLVLVKPNTANYVVDPATGQMVPAGSLAVTVDTPTPEPSVTPEVTLAPGQTATPKPSPTATPQIYCQGRTPCYGPNALAAHSSPGNCWGYNIDQVFNLTAYAPVHPGGPVYIQTSVTCGLDISAVLKGTMSSGGGKQRHQDATINNSPSSLMASYRVGYYDPKKP